MTKRKETGRALFLSIVSLVLSMSMLVGTTMAWFTDSVESGKNQILAGNLDIELEYSDDMAEDSWVSVNGRTDVIDPNALWEPGRTEVVYLRITNKGTLALKYQFAMNFTDTVIGKSVEGNDIYLSKYLKYAVVDVTEKYASRDAAREAVKDVAVDLANYGDAGVMEAGVPAKTVALVIYMPETVNNEANYRGTDIPKIEVGIELQATQLANEHDSFGNDYDDETENDLLNVLYTFNGANDLNAFEPSPDNGEDNTGLSINNGAATINTSGAWYPLEADLAAYEYSIAYDLDITSLTEGQSIIVDTGEQTKWGSTPIYIERGSAILYAGLAKNEYIGTLEGTKLHVVHLYSLNEEGKLEIATTITDGVETLQYAKVVDSSANTKLYWDIYTVTEAGKAVMDNYHVTAKKADVNNGAELASLMAKGGKVVLTNDVFTNEAIVIPEGVTVSLDLNGKNITGNTAKDAGAILVNNGTLTVTGGTMSNTSVNGDSVIKNAGTLVLKDVNIVGAPMGTTGYPAYAVSTSGSLTIEAGTSITADRGAVTMNDGAEVIINGGSLVVSGAADGRNMTLHTIYAYGYNSKLTINGGYFEQGHTSTGGASVICPAGATINIYGGDFRDAMDDSNWTSTGNFQNYMGYGAPVNVYGGTFDDATVNKNLAEGYIAVDNGDGTYSVLFPQSSLEELIENAGSGDTVEVPAGTYTFPASDLKAGMTLECAEGTVFEGKTSLNISGATVVGATFTSSDNYLIYQGTVNGIFKECIFTNTDGLRSCIAGETVVFEDCVFDGDLYAVHFDSGANDVIFRRCTFSGFNTFGAQLTNLTMEECTFVANGKSNYNGINLWGTTDLIGCTFVFDGSAKYEWVDLRGDSDKTVTFVDCVVTNGETEKGMETVVGNGSPDNGKVIINDVPLVFSNNALKVAVADGAMKVLLADGEYDLQGNQKDGLTLVGVGDNVKMANNTKYAGGKAIGAIWQAIKLENMTITNTVYTMADGGKSTFTGVRFAAGFRQGYGTAVVFDSCSFGSNSEGYALHFQTDSASEGGKIVLNGCKFEGGKVHLGGKRTYEFTGCDFATGTDFQVWSGITLQNCTVNGENVTADNANTFFSDLNMEKVTIK